MPILARWSQPVVRAAAATVTMFQRGGRARTDPHTHAQTHTRSPPHTPTSAGRRSQRDWNCHGPRRDVDAGRRRRRQTHWRTRHPLHLARPSVRPSVRPPPFASDFASVVFAFVVFFAVQPRSTRLRPIAPLHSFSSIDFHDCPSPCPSLVPRTFLSINACPTTYHLFIWKKCSILFQNKDQTIQGGNSSHTIHSKHRRAQSSRPH